MMLRIHALMLVSAPVPQADALNETELVHARHRVAATMEMLRQNEGYDVMHQFAEHEAAEAGMQAAYHIIDIKTL